jgi:hypothetical protein
MQRLFACLTLLLLSFPALAAEGPIRVGLFDVDATPPVGSVMAYDPVKEIEGQLHCKGLVLLGADKPVVLCSLDWIGVANESYDLFRAGLAKAAGTTPDHVALHVIHQHDAPWADLTTDKLVTEFGIPYRPFDSKFVDEVIGRVAKSVTVAIEHAQEVTHVGTGVGRVEKVASNRRVMGPDGKVLHVRWSATKDPEVRAYPEGLIDPELKLVMLYAGERPIVALTYYATHPQSYYRTGKANPDFPGLARDARQKATGVPHIHFNGASGNITAGKYNDGSHENRQIFADRVAAAMKTAFESVERQPLKPNEVSWRSVSVRLPASPLFDEQKMLATINNKEEKPLDRFTIANNLAWLRRAQQGENKIDLSCLTLGRVKLLHMPGELFIEYQLEAQRLRPDCFVAMAAYGEYGPAYIGTAISYTQGGYETGPTASHVGPESEAILMRGIAELLHVDEAKLRPLR